MSSAKQWFEWKCGDFEHSLNLSQVIQWLYKAPPNEHAFVWHAAAGCDDHLQFVGEQARKFRRAMRAYMRSK